MHHIQLTSEDEKNLRFHSQHSTCCQIRTRCLAILMRGQGFQQDTVEKLTGAALRSQTNWGRTWNKGGLKALLISKHEGRKSSLQASDLQLLGAHFEAKPPETLVEACERVYQTTGRKFSLPGVRNLLRNKLKINRRKAKQVPPRCDDLKKKQNRKTGMKIS
jgi:transposase